MPKIIHTKHSKVSGRVLPLVFPPAASSRRERLRAPREPFHERHPSVFNNFRLSRSKLFSAISYTLITLLAPIISVATNHSSVFATQPSTTKNFTFAIEVTDTPTLTMVLSESKLTLGLTPGMASNTFSSGDLNVTVGTSNNAGYTLTMTADSSSLSTTSGNTIPSLVPKTGGYT
ncbi:hypothetical protein IKE79_00340, partial [Candidatus Saccharibacteria bacterium]|nr:hypothetical protein [Candidatus Saccharibacteria bacterium]